MQVRRPAGSGNSVVCSDTCICELSLRLQRRADFLDVGAVGADGLVELLAGDVELFGPIGDVGGEFGVDLVGIVRALGVVFMRCVGSVLFRLLLVFVGLIFGHAGTSSLVGLLYEMRMRWVGMYGLGAWLCEVL